MTFERLFLVKHLVEKNQIELEKMGELEILTKLRDNYIEKIQYETNRNVIAEYEQ